MNRREFELSDKCSVSLMSLIGRQESRIRPSAAATMSGFRPQSAERVSDDDRVAVIIDTESAETTGNMLADVGAAPERLGDNFISADVGVYAARDLVGDTLVRRIQTKKQHVPTLDNALPEIARRDPGNNNPTGHDGDGVLIGIVDSGFDLSHPMFRDEAGNLRVEGLLDQDNGNRSFTQSELQNQWSSGTGPGHDTNGHGTHVATIAGGSAFGSLEGVAPKTRFLLVKTDFFNVDKGVRWIFDQAGTNPCVVNLSLGNHFGAHDGSDLSEELYQSITGPGKLLVASAGNERNDSIHIGSRFSRNESQRAEFDIFRQPVGNPFAVITLWYDASDEFACDLVTPTGQTLPIPHLGQAQVFQGTNIDIELSKKSYFPTGLTQLQITIDFSSRNVPNRWLNNWTLQLSCTTATIGRIDGWFNNSGFARFHPGPLVEISRTIGLPATSRGAIAVASHVTKDEWDSDDGHQQDHRIVIGRTSPFSSLGPTRDGRQKPEVSAPGQYVTSALATDSSLADEGDRAEKTNRVVSIEGTSMSAPVVTGVVALMLQKKPGLTPDQVRQIISDTAVKDRHTGVTQWTLSYGYGKIDASAAVVRT
ncbi:MAG: S8 family serine peptidase [Pseudomonadota bacterium]